MIIGVISDIHRRLSDEACKALSGSDYIICAGDIENPGILIELQCIAPTICVQGNCDRFFDKSVNFSASPLLGGLRFRIVHRPEDIGTLTPDVKVVIHGHTHIPRNQVINGVRFINPGSPTKPRGGSNKSVAKIYIENGEIASVDFIELP